MLRVNRPVSRFTIVRLGSATHAFNNDQRFHEVENFTRIDSDRYRLRFPGNRNAVPPGYYMLFAIDQDGVPSEAKIIYLGRPPS
ncbi:MAG: DUF1929 domain-containing protein [Rhodospirillales bacterium]|nr:DUF1929 domain-containing protein [Rhodospirillales bacterium]